MSLTSWLKKKLEIDTINQLLIANSNKLNILLNLINSLNTKVNLTTTTEITKTEYYLDPEIKNSINNIKLDILEITGELTNIRNSIKELKEENTKFKNDEHILGFVDKNNNIYIYSDSLNKGTYSIKYLGDNLEYDNLTEITI